MSARLSSISNFNSSEDFVLLGEFGDPQRFDIGMFNKLFISMHMCDYYSYSSKDKCCMRTNI